MNTPASRPAIVIEFERVSAVLVTRGDVDLDPVEEQIHPGSPV